MEKYGGNDNCLLFISPALSAQARVEQPAKKRYMDDHTLYNLGEHMDWAYDQGIAVGNADGYFMPYDKVTRAEAATMLVNYMGIDAELYGDSCEIFTDVEDGKWYTRYVNAAYENGIMEGKGSGIFAPEEELTRAEAATLIVNAMGYDLVDEGENKFTDVGDEWYARYVNTAEEKRIVAGVDKEHFEPDTTVRRVHMVTMIHNTRGEDFVPGKLHGLYFFLNDMYGYEVYNSKGQKLNVRKLDNYWLYWGDPSTYYECDFDGENFFIIEAYYGFLGMDAGTFSFPEDDAYIITKDDGKIDHLEGHGYNGTMHIKNTTNVDSVEFRSDGTIHLKGTDMTYTAAYESVTYYLERTDTGMNDVVLKVVDKQLVAEEE